MLDTKTVDEEYRKDAIRAAEELKYSDSTVEAIRNAKSDYEISKILSRARSNIAD